MIGATFFVPINNVAAQEDLPFEPFPAVEDPIPFEESAADMGEVAPELVDVLNISETVSDLVDTGESEVIIDEVLQDETMTTEDLGAIQAAILPDQPFLHGFKIFGRGLKEAFTFDPLKKAEVRLDHANQQLSEIQQLVDERGIRNIDGQMLSEAIDYYEAKIEQVREQASVLREGKTDDPIQIDSLLNKFTDQQLNQQKVFDNIAKEVIEAKEAAQEGEDVGSIEQIVAQVEDAKDSALENLTATLVEVEDNPQAVADRFNNVLAYQAEGKSKFYELKNLEILEAVAQKVPDSAKEVIESAKQDTLDRFEVALSALPPVVRAEKFETYVSQASSDEAHLMGLLEEIKQFAGIPPDVLAKVELAKEATVRSFENKLRLFDDVRVEERFYRGFGTDMGDMVALTEFKNRMAANSQEFAMMEDFHSQSIQNFKDRFTDPDSVRQAELFAELSRQAATNPTPKTFELLAALEAEVSSDPEKAAFINQIESNVGRQFEDRFRQEGVQFMDRIASLDPRDMATIGQFGFGDRFVNEFAARNAKHYKGYMQDVYVPEQFDRFHERFFDIPEYVFNEIRENDPDFQDIIQYKTRKMQELKLEQEREFARAGLDYEEREINFQMDRLDRQKWEDFNSQINEVPWEDFDTRQNLWEQRINEQYTDVEVRMEEQKKLFEERLVLDPWCDSVCELNQRMSFEQQMRHEKERLGDDLMLERNRIESERARFQSNNPLAGFCDTFESCDAYCRDHAGEPGCEWMVVDRYCPPPSYFDPGIDDCYYPSEFQQTAYVDCGPGEFYDGFSCVNDPYYHPPTDFQNCGWGMQWNEQLGFCEPDYQPRLDPNQPSPGDTYPPDPGSVPGIPGRPDPGQPGPTYGCGPGYYFDDGKQYCVPECGPGYYYDDYRGCVVELNCPAGFYSDTWSGECIQECGPNEYFDHYENRCIVDNWQQCGPGEYWDPGRGSCLKNFVECNFYAEPRICAPGEEPVPPDPYDFCGQSSCVPEMPSDCPSFAAYPAPCPEGQVREDLRDERNCPIFGECIPSPYPPLVPVVGICPDVWNPVCGTDKVTYGNDCEAKSAGVAIDYYGSCTSEQVDCGYDKWWSPELSLCLSNDDYVPPSSGSCEYGWSWNPSGFCDQDSSVVDQCTSYCDPACSGSSYCNFDQFGCATGCSEGSIGYCGDFICNDGETAFLCSIDCQDDSTYEGDEYSCPSFAYSRWDVTGTRYCQLNNEASCSYFYPDYLSDTNYSPDNCPVDDDSTTSWCGDGVCGSNESDYSCPTDCGGITSCPATAYNDYSSESYCSYTTCSNGCTWDFQGCPSGCYDPDYQCPANSYTDSTDTRNCNYSECSSGCNYDSQGCPSGCVDPSDFCGSGWSWNESADSCIQDGVTCTNVSACSTCPSGTTNSWCEWDYNGCPLGCQESVTDSGDCGSINDQTSCESIIDCYWESSYNYCYYQSYVCNYDGTCNADESSPQCGDCTSSSSCNYNSTCEQGESYENCSADCPSSLNFCGNGSCEPGENSGNCYSDCGGPTSWCGDNVCDSDESEYSCPADCTFDAGYCGDDSCGIYETTSSCPADCGGVSCPSSQYNYYGTGSTCNTGQCSAGCDYDGSGCPIGCKGSNTACNKDGICDYGESSGSCPADCGGAGYCGDNICNNGETLSSCAGDCGTSGSCNYNGVCDVDETINSCASDCSSSSSCPANQYNGYTTGWSCDYSICPSGCNYDSQGCSDGCYDSTVSTCNYNGICDSEETSATCWNDCAPTCTSNQYNDYTTGYTCSYSACPNGCDYDSLGCPSGCYSGGEECNYNGVCDGNEDSYHCPGDCSGPTGYCGDYICDSGETASSCPADCGSSGDCASNYNYCYTETDCTANGYGWCNGYCWSSYESSSCATSSDFCGDYICGSSETSSSCPSDCGGPSSWCGDNVCDSSEDSSWCPSDCGAVQGASTSKVHPAVLVPATYNDTTYNKTISFNPLMIFKAVYELVTDIF